jgi:hypothetical protein
LKISYSDKKIEITIFRFTYEVSNLNNNKKLK